MRDVTKIILHLFVITFYLKNKNVTGQFGWKTPNLVTRHETPMTQPGKVYMHKNSVILFYMQY